MCKLKQSMKVKSGKKMNFIEQRGAIEKPAALLFLSPYVCMICVMVFVITDVVPRCFTAENRIKVH